jgi:hypothetical protein
MYRLSHYLDGEWKAHSYPPVFDVSQRLVAGVPDGDPLVFQTLVERLTPPFQLLYVLHTPRGEADPGRYQSPPISLEQFREFVQTFSSFLKADGRFDLWAHSGASGATVVWDRHNRIFAYGPLEHYTEALTALGFSRGTPVVPTPHTHHYRDEFDEAARRLLQTYVWSRSPLHPGDVQ